MRLLLGRRQLTRVHHSDPFDRLLIVRAVAEPLKLLTADTILAEYSDLVMWV